MIEQVQRSIWDRSFIAFSIEKVPEIGLEGEEMLYAKQWHFRADMRMDGHQFWVDWYQPEQDNEPAPDKRCFFQAIAVLLANAERRP